MTNNDLELILVRHGQTDANVARQWVGRRETALTDLGRAQAQAVARRLAEQTPRAHAVYTSPLSRALHTAQAIAQALGVDPVVIDGLREIDFGTLDGMTLQEMASQYPDVYARWQNKTDNEFTWPGGERRADFFLRAAAACDDILTRHTSGAVVIVAHGGTLRSVLLHLLHTQMEMWWKYEINNGSITRVVVENGAARLVALNDTAHLPAEAP
ncbi:MAG: histidine phosphatase family protein [Anaerolineae bacterium]|nr:histidine phosphatase family protein [Anaerolineae bacterium]